MGLSVSHDAFYGAYSAFNRLRKEVARAMGGSFPPHFEEDEQGNLVWGENGLLKRTPDLREDSWYWGRGYSAESHPGLFEFLSHSDCDGEISPETCVAVADDLEALLPKMRDISGGGHLENAGGVKKALEKFIAGCRLAHKENEPLVFG